MKIIINNKTKDITDTVFIIKVYQFLHDAEISQHLKIFKDFMPITFENYVCICRRLKNGYSFTFKEKEQL